ncbi:hypothetical protein Sjap_020366 [Stephania japonica]|uniref:Uncharacterized protein n=1 Tax=Stephania japonica TaxID=461633 RepID=A0AAP0F630_9MAGN
MLCCDFRRGVSSTGNASLLIIPALAGSALPLISSLLPLTSSSEAFSTFSVVLDSPIRSSDPVISGFILVVTLLSTNP